MFIPKQPEDAESLTELPHFKSISINVSASSLVTPEYQFRFNSLIAGKLIAPNQITLELIEREFLEGNQNVLDILVNLRIKGVGLSLDDFGTGYSSLSLFHTLPFSELKVDKSFTKTMLSNAQSLNIVRSCIDLAKRMELKVIAEGVESHEIYEHLQHEWCDSAQGFYIAKPMPIKALMSWNANFNHQIYN
ncbi:EAL domain-containing protein [Grimontia kaedaensis]|uniref:EAL domain-containing protein n=1 Tax=Grimontia kaedaensis TaxID=2872157 RepID=A0ABY4X2Y3_9GAMM|nr:EAL domain-containing protein [Grimontia kaedaensis]